MSSEHLSNIQLPSFQKLQPEVFRKKVILKTFAKLTRKYVSHFNMRLEGFCFIKKEDPTKVFSSEFCEIFEEYLFHKTPAEH